MADSAFTIVLRLQHPTMDPNEFTAALGMEPDRCWSKGSVRLRVDGTMAGGWHKKSGWMKVIAEDHFDNQLFGYRLSLLTQEMDKSRAFLSDFRRSGGITEIDATWVIGASWMEERLDHLLLAQIGGLGVDLILWPLAPSETAGMPTDL